MEKFAIIGTGYIFPKHLEAIQEVGKIVGLDTDEDYVSILTPNDTHFKYCVKYAELGKKVLCEKPLVLNSSHINVLAKYPNIYSVMQLRYHPLVKGIKTKKQNEIEMEICVHRDEKYFLSWKGKERRSGGILFNLGVHYFDLLFYLYRKGKKN